MIYCDAVTFSEVHQIHYLFAPLYAIEREPFLIPMIEEGPATVSIWLLDRSPVNCRFLNRAGDSI